MSHRDNRDAVAVVKLPQPTALRRVRVLVTRGSRSRPFLAAINEVEVLAGAE